MKIEFSLNGSQHSVNVDPRENLLHLLREYIQLRGTKYGCGEGECGACTVLVDDQPVSSCLVLAGQVNGANIITIEGMEKDPIGQHVISAFVTQGAVQCGFCIPGMIISARALLSQNPSPTINEIQFALGGNLCRCTGYKKIIEAILSAGEKVSTHSIRMNGNGCGHKPLRAKNFVRPESLEEALTLLAARDDWQIISGCTDYGVQNEYHLKDKKLLNLSGMEKVCGIGEDEQFVRIGGGTTFSDILESPLVEEWAKPLCQAAKKIGAVQIQNRGTLAGNIVNASPAADSVPPLFVLDASVILRSIRGARTVPINEFATGPAITVMAPDEILVAVNIPKKRFDGSEITFFSKFGSRNAQTISIASVAMRGWLEDGHLKGVSIALGAVAPTVILGTTSAEQLMSGKLTEKRILNAAKLASESCRPIDDLRASAGYRRRLVHGLLVKNLIQYLPYQESISG
jgi:carbon-monoxide dehydrogenase small subunit/xanthine dehydrogenase small subunit